MKIMDLTKGQKLLEIHCIRNSYKKPKYRLISKTFDKYRNYYKVSVEVKDQIICYGHGISKRMAKNDAAIRAFKKLQFKQCNKTSVSELIKYCERNGFSFPIFDDECDDECDDGIYRVRCRLKLYFNKGDVQLLGIGRSDSYKLAKISAAKDIIQQLKDIELIRNEFPVYNKSEIN